MTAVRDAGLAVERGEVVAVAANVLVCLEPGPIAARMPSATASFRDSAESLAREVRLAAALSAAGAPVVAPLGGPYEACGLTVTLWPTWPSPGDRARGHRLTLLLLIAGPRAAAKRPRTATYASARSTCRVS
jgi:hypothetical protein